MAGVDDAPPGVDVADGLGWRPAAPVDAVVGNPPFRSPLTVGVGHDAALGAYTDLAARFLVASADLVRPGGRVVLVQPESLLAARDAEPVRRKLLDRAALEGLWVAGEAVFSAQVRVCAPVLRVGATQPTSVARWNGADVTATTPADVDPSMLATWAPLRPTSVPAHRSTGKRTVGDLATATAGFRDEFYGLAAAAREATGAGGEARLVTSGLVDPGRVCWGERSCRLGGVRYERPVVDVDDLPPRVRAWVRRRAVPKVLVATQTKVVEAAADHDGGAVAVTPVVAVVTHDPADVDRVAAALTSPIVTAWALTTFGGTALHHDAVKLSARQVLQAPLPDDDDAWAVATVALGAGDVDGCAVALAGDDHELLAWWRERIRLAPARRPG